MANPIRTGASQPANGSIISPSAISAVTTDPLRHSFSEASRSRRRSNGVKNNSCEVLIQNRPEFQKKFNILRKGYPKSPWRRQTKGKEFRKAAEGILKALASRTADITGVRSRARIIVLMPWRSGLAFGKSYRNLGVRRFYHLSSQRDEKTLHPVVNYELCPALEKNDVIIIADPMLATGHTILDAVLRIKKCGALTQNIIINSVVAAPIGVTRIKQKYPKIRIITGALDKKLDKRGFIVPGLGDFGDKYFAEMNEKGLKKFIASFKLPAYARKMLKNRFRI
ncbi:MAG: uracil phosphoribosyltransferase [Candidatus Sungbacteria bacterium]|nr:uracil phosphoribosyltransferase [Candidatus Sungbacteria bacterium]